MKIKKGVTLIAEEEGTGNAANQGDVIDFDLEINLNKGDNVSKDNYVRKLNRANMIPGIVYAIIAMKEGGYREVKISPHLAHKEKGVLGVIPENAFVNCQKHELQRRHLSLQYVQEMGRRTFNVCRLQYRCYFRRSG